MTIRSHPCGPLLAATAAALLATGVVAAPAGSAACAAKSGPQTAALVELFTSEGCNSCPPADRWLSATFRDGLATRAIPLAFHVDYWDRLGWKDRFGAAAYTERQYAAMHANGSRFVYTPQVLVQGKDVPDWSTSLRAAGARAAISAANGTPARADIALEAAPRTGAVTIKAEARIADAADRKAASLYIALTQDGLASDVKAGENAGVRLAHDHVVRAFREGAKADAGGALSAEWELPLPNDGGRAFTVVAFVQNPGNGDVLQAVALPLSSSACTP